jgi:RNA polymerase sigma-70 factor (ECF subfamily)
VRETGFFGRILSTIAGKGDIRGKFFSIPDEKLVEAFINENNQSAFEEIVARYADRIYGLALRITRDPGDAEEVLQEVFLALVRKMDTFRQEAKFSSWLYRVAVNASYMHLRSQRKHDADTSLDEYTPYDENGTLMGRVASRDWSDRPDKALISKEAMETIEKAVAELPESYRVVFHLRDIEGLSNEEVADILGLSVPAVKSRLHRGRLFLRDKLSDYFYEWSK